MPKKKYNPENDDEEDNSEKFADEDEYETEEENSDEEEENDEFEEDEPNFMDNSGQLWKFVCRIGDGQNLEEFMGHMEGMMAEKEDNKKWKKFGCVKNRRCPFQAIFLKSCSNLYSRGAHNHGQVMKNEVGTSRKIEDNKSVEAAIPKHYQFYAKIKNEEHLEKIVKQNELCVTAKKRKPHQLMRNYYECKKNSDYRKSPQHQLRFRPCTFHGIYEVKSGQFFTTKKGHNHHIKLKTKKKFGLDYVDCRGKLWKFFGEIGKNTTMEMMRNEYGFSIIQKTKQGFYLQCMKTAGIKGRCKYAGVYLRENGCLYTRGQHEHGRKILEKREKEKPLKKELVSAETADNNSFVDRFGNLWPFAAQIGKNLKENEFPSKFGNCRKRTKYGYYFQCTRMGGCQRRMCCFRAIYVESSGCVYAKTLEHNVHSL